MAQSFDFIVVGGGSAGAVIASRLSEDPACHVALIEAGDQPPQVSSVAVACAAMQLSPESDWMFSAEPGQAGLGLNGRRIPVPRGKMLGGSSSINYMVEGSKAARLEAVIAAMDEAVLSAWCRERAYRRAPAQIILDLYATDDPLHGNQEGRFFHGYYDCHCYLPLYAFSGRHLLAAKLRRSNIDSLGAAPLAEDTHPAAR